jgi:hypothetical protein
MSLQEEEVFWLLTGESKETLKEGRRVEAVIRWVGNDEARAQLPAFNNLDAVLQKNDISSTQPPPEPRDRLRANDTVAARCGGSALWEGGECEGGGAERENVGERQRETEKGRRDCVLASMYLCGV